VARKKSIGQVILGKTLPTLFVRAIIATLALLSVLFLIVQDDIETRHENRVQLVESTYNRAISDQQKLLQTISTNSHVINALQNPSSYSSSSLGVYLSSLEFGVIRFADVTVISQYGNVIATSDTLKKQPDFNLKNMPWFNDVIVQKQTYYQAKVDSITFVIPVLSNSETLGAIIAEYESLEPFLLFNFEESVVLITNPEQRILYTSDRNEFTPFALIDWSLVNDWRLAFEAEIDDLSIYGLEKSNLYFQEIYKLLGFALISVIFIIFSSLMSARLAGKLAAGTIDQFVSSLNNVKRKTDNGIVKFKLPFTEATELQQLSSEFQHLLKDLTESNLTMQRVSALMNSLNDLLVVFDQDGNITLSNRSFDKFLKATGIPSERALATLFFRRNHSELLDNHTPFPPVEKRYLIEESTTSNPYKTIHWSRHILMDDELITGVTFVGMDTTKSYELESEIHLKEAAIDGANSGIIILEIEEYFSKIIYANKGIGKLLNIDPKTLEGDLKFFIEHFNINRSAFQRINLATLSGLPVIEVLETNRNSTADLHIELTLSPVTLPRETSKVYYLGILKDVTEQQTTAKLLLEAKQKAEESAEMKSSFLASMSHEIRTPMNGVIGMLDILNESKLEAQQKNYVNIAQNSAESLLTIINDILDFSKVEAGKLEIDNIDFNLSDMLDGFIDSMAHQAHSKQLELILDTSEIEHQFVKGDPGRLRQIMTNLVSNAIKFTTHGEIIIRARLAFSTSGDLMLEMTITDSGIGIPHEKQAHLFEPFTQVDGSNRRKQQGTGLGLAIVKQLSEAMNGHVWVTSETDVGSTFGFKVQLYTSKRTAPNLPVMDIAGRRILVVDDNKQNCQVMCKQLEKWQVETRRASSGLEALEILESDPTAYDAAIIDMNMPSMDGALLGQSIKSQPVMNQLKLVLMTSISQRGDAQYFANLGFDAYFPKPATSTDIIDALSILFENGSASDDADPLVTQHYVRSLRHDQSFTRSYRVLLVEDNAVNQMISRKYIQTLGLNATIAHDGQVALDTLKNAETPFDLILMDCQMPVLDGFEATRKIRTGEAGDRYLNTPIIAMTANAMKGDRERCLEAGMDDYISKPLRKDVLAKTLKGWLSRL
jgi:signal transduction histidine kinase/DNA-binding response OmpR family regulator